MATFPGLEAIQKFGADKGEAVAIHWPAEDAHAWLDGHVLVRDAPSREAAHRLANTIVAVAARVTVGGELLQGIASRDAIARLTTSGAIHPYDDMAGLTAFPPLDPASGVTTWADWQDARQRFRAARGGTAMGADPLLRAKGLAIPGSSGWGKATLPRTIGGSVRPSAGRPVLAGRDATGLPPERRPTNMALQGHGLLPHTSVRANLGHGLRLARVPAPSSCARGCSSSTGRRRRSTSRSARRGGRSCEACTAGSAARSCSRPTTGARPGGSPTASK